MPYIRTREFRAAESDPVLERAFTYWRNIDQEVGDRIAREFQSELVPAGHL